MHAVAVLSSLALLGSVAGADDAKPATSGAPNAVAANGTSRSKVPLRVVKVLDETRQALLFDKIRGTHVLAEVGTSIEGYMVVDIDEDEVTLQTSAGAEIVLVVPALPARAHEPRSTAEPKVREVEAGRPIDPYAESAKDPAKQPVDPYAEPVRVVEAPKTPGPVTPAAPIVAGEGGVRIVEAPKTPATPATPAPTPVAVDPPADAPIVIARAELDGALSDFSKLAASARGAFTPTGVRVDSVLAGSLFAKVGIRAGDTIVAVDGKPLRSLDDAASVYARASTARNVTLQLVRGGKAVSLRVTIR